MHPDDERYKALVGKHVILPLVGRRIPIVADEYADPEKGSGAVKITPAHDFNDFEVGKRHDLPMINISSPRQALLDPNDDHLTTSRTRELRRDTRGLDRFAARKTIVEPTCEALGPRREDRDDATPCRTATAPTW